MALKALFTTLAISLALNSTVQGAEFKTLSGELRDTLHASQNPYLVTSIIVVPSGETVICEAGVVLLFKAFTGLQIQGQFLSEGTEESPVVFTSENDKVFVPTSKISAASYDWDGISIDEASLGTKFHHTKIQYSLYGINALNDRFELDSCIFTDNGKSDLVIKGKKQIKQKGPVSYNPTPVVAALPNTELQPIVQTSPPQEFTDTNNNQQKLSTPLIPAKKTSSGKTFFRIANGLLIGGGGALGVYEYLNYQKSQRAFAAINDTTNTAHNGSAKEQADRWNNAYHQKNQDFIGTLAGCGIAVLGLIGFTLTFVF